MTAPYFLDTNVLVYATSLAADHAPKREAARAWAARTDWGVSTQVLMELYAQARRWSCATATTSRTGTLPSCAPRAAWAHTPWSART
jgi:predicted nucleic acid-binding protein